MATFTGKNNDYDDIKKDARNLGNDVKDAANNATSTVKKGVANVIGMNTQDFADLAQEAGQNVRQFIDDTSAQAIDARDRLEQRVVSNPMSSIAIAAIGGFLLGSFLRK